MRVTFEHAYCVGHVEHDPHKNDITVHGTMTDTVDDGRIMCVAASPPDYRSSYTGSALPFATADIAFDSTPNKGVVELLGNAFVIKLLHPNSYYQELGRVLIPPTLFIRYTSNGEERTVPINVAKEVPFRLLTYPSMRHVEHSVAFDYLNLGPLFYAGTEKLPIRTQAQILMDSTYPAENIQPTTPEEYWGTKPRC